MEATMVGAARGLFKLQTMKTVEPDYAQHVNVTTEASFRLSEEDLLSGIRNWKEESAGVARPPQVSGCEFFQSLKDGLEKRVIPPGQTRSLSNVLTTTSRK
jgi:hypothetical protein